MCYKLKANPNSDPPSYRARLMCFMLEWVVPVPCTCCPTGEYVLKSDEPDAPAEEANAVAVYVGGNSALGTRHLWQADGRYRVTDCGGDTIRLIRAG